MRPIGSASELEVRRRLAVGMLAQGKSVTEVARLVGATHPSVIRWREMLRRGGQEALKGKPHPGPRPRLTPLQRDRLVKFLLKGPREAGYTTDLWTCARVAEVIERRFGVHYHPDHAWRILRSLGWSCQMPERRARERDEKAIAQWRQDRWPHIKKGSSTRRQHRIPG